MCETDGLIKEAIVPRPSVADRVREMSEDRRSQLLQQYMENEVRSWEIFMQLRGVILLMCR